MRFIFRAWDKINKRICFNFFIASDGEIYRDKDVHGVNMEGYRKIYTKGDDFILMQFTGCLDVKANHIFEDDILDAPWSQLFKVSWSPFYYGWALVSTDGNPIPFDKVQISLFEITGNIHQNKF